MRGRLRAVPPDLAERLRSAAAGLTEASFDAVRVEDLVEASGIPKTTLYYYFRGKNEILEFLLADFLERMAVEVERAVGAPGRAADRLVALIRAQFRAMAAHIGTCRALLTELSRASGLPELSDAVEGAVHGPIAALVREGARDGSLRPVDAEVVAVAVFAVVSHLGFHQLAREGRIDPERLAGEAERLLLSGLAPEPARAAGER
ncbi:MAG: TetR/AcrR family transcriptional regulator [Acidimicrobiia bacterium]|nr:TetR/AcrR family transcriptional regulator [Acidimicrobiia bacterium]